MQNLVYMIFNPKKEMDKEKDVLGCLSPFCNCEISENDEDIIKALHDKFCEDFIGGSVMLDDKRVKVKPYVYNGAHKDHLPEWYNGLTEKFVHIITREKKETKQKSSKKIREFRSERALRIHWIKPIIENCNDKRIRRFKCLESAGNEREYFWFLKGYMVVVEFINPDIALITGFCIDQDNHAYYMRKYQNRIK